MTVTHTGQAHAHRPQVNAWLAAVIALAAALIALGTWVIVDQTRSSSTQGLASPETVTVLNDRIAAVNSGDAQAISAFYTRDAVLEERDVTPEVITRGSEQIGGRIRGLTQLGLRLKSESPVIRFGNTVAEAASMPGSGTEGFILVYALEGNKIAHQWVLPAG